MTTKEMLHGSVRDGDEDTWLTTRRLYEPYTLPCVFFAASLWSDGPQFLSEKREDLKHTFT